jgi:flagellar hook-basal body complex protein FliE
MSDLKMESITSSPPRSDIEAMLSKIRALSGSAKAFSTSSVASAEKASPFQEVMSIAKNAIQSVSQSQDKTDAMKSAYLMGDKNVSISQVMISSIKSKVAFEGLLAVRNKLIESYKEIMNMPI